MKPSRLKYAAALTSVAVLTLAAAAPALAESTTANDPADATGSLSDIRRVSINHGLNQIITKVKFTDLEPSTDGGPSSLAIYLDTNPRRVGPEFRLGTGLQTGTDYQLVKTKGFKATGDPLTCNHSVRLNFEDDVVAFRASRSCFGNPAKIRVGVKMTDAYDGSHPISDWLGIPRSFTTWVAAG